MIHTPRNFTVGSGYLNKVIYILMNKDPTQIKNWNWHSINCNCNIFWLEVVEIFVLPFYRVFHSFMIFHFIGTFHFFLENTYRSDGGAASPHLEPSQRLLVQVSTSLEIGNESVSVGESGQRDS